MENLAEAAPKPSFRERGSPLLLQILHNELIKRAITEGLNPAGEPLDRTMPRWQMSEEDLDDLLEFLKTLD